MLTIKLFPNPHPHNVVFINNKSKTNNFSDSTSLYPDKLKSKQWNVLLSERSNPLRTLQSIVNSIVNSTKKNRVYIVRSIYKCFKLSHQTLRSLITPFHHELIRYNINNSITFIHCHLFVLYLHFIAGLKCIHFCEYLRLQCLS